VKKSSARSTLSDRLSTWSSDDGRGDTDPARPAPFAAAVRRNGGVMIANQRIGVQELIDALNALDAAEAAA
jgi:hypothetical protein